MLIDIIVKELITEGFLEICDGVYLHSQENIQADQAQWPEEDECKTFDFDQAEYWIITDTGHIEGFDDIHNAIGYCFGVK